MKFSSKYLSIKGVIMKNSNTIFNSLLCPKKISFLRDIFSIKHIILLAMILGSPLLYANTCATAEVITTINNPVMGSVQDGSGNVNEYFYAMSPGVAAHLTLSNYSSTENTDVYFSTSCTGNKILNNGKTITSESLTSLASETIYISIHERAN